MREEIELALKVQEINSIFVEIELLIWNLPFCVCHLEIYFSDD